MKQLIPEKTDISPKDQIITFIDDNKLIKDDTDLQEIMQTIQTGFEFRFKVEEKSDEEKRKDSANKQQCSPIFNEVRDLKRDRERLGLSKRAMEERLKHTNNNPELKALAGQCPHITQQLQTLEHDAPSLSRRAIDRKIDVIIRENGGNKSKN